MKKLFLLTVLFSSAVFAHRPLGRDAINSMNMIISQSVRNCIDQLNSRHAGDFMVQRATLHEAGINSEYHLFGAFLEDGDMVHGSAHVDVKIRLSPPMGPGDQCQIISEKE